MKNRLYPIILLFFFGLAIISCSDDDDNSNNNPGGGGNNSGCSGGPSTVTDIDGNTYNVVSIGNQCWMKENLRVSKYRNGDPIPTNLSGSQWGSTTNGACAVYDNDPANNAIYGKLYNWYAVADSRGLCPTGWHVPSDADWNQLIFFLDSDADTSTFGEQSPFAGGMLKATGTIQAATGIWLPPNTDATNSSGFSGLPAGECGNDGVFNHIGFIGEWWSSSISVASMNLSTTRYLNYNSGRAKKSERLMSTGFSVRCLRD